MLLSSCPACVSMLACWLRGAGTNGWLPSRMCVPMQTVRLGWGCPWSSHPSRGQSLVLHAGNVARFINHSCAPNLLKQTVLIEGDHGLKHRITFFTTDVRRHA
jgi:SET domain